MNPRRGQAGHTAGQVVVQLHIVGSLGPVGEVGGKSLAVGQHFAQFCNFLETTAPVVEAKALVDILGGLESLKIGRITINLVYLCMSYILR